MPDGGGRLGDRTGVPAVTGATRAVVPAATAATSVPGSSEAVSSCVVTALLFATCWSRVPCRAASSEAVKPGSAEPASFTKLSTELSCG
jgi:hypothetical protein